MTLILVIGLTYFAILSNIDNAIFIAKGSAKNTIPVNVNAKIIASGRADTTQGIDMTKRLGTDELRKE